MDVPLTSYIPQSDIHPYVSSIAVYGYPTYTLYTPVRQPSMRKQRCSEWECYLQSIYTNQTAMIHKQFCSIWMRHLQPIYTGQVIIHAQVALQCMDVPLTSYIRQSGSHL